MHDDSDWTPHFTAERSRLLAALGEVADGGIIENSAHVGSTSVPGLSTSSCVDIAVAVWPFPLEEARLATLQELGYLPIPGYNEAPELRLRHASGKFQLILIEPGDERWMDRLLLRDYLCHNAAARQQYVETKVAAGAPMSKAWQNAKEFLFPVLQQQARQWWIDKEGFAPVQRVAQELTGFDHPWYIASGWAIDLHLRQVTRVHHDVDVVVDRADQLALRQHLTDRGWKFVTPLNGKLEPWPPHMRLEQPRHQFHAHRDGAFIDFLLTDFQPGLWRYRRNPIIVRAQEQMSLVSADGLPYLAPELVLLFKSKNTSAKERGKDHTDFRNVVAHLDPEPRAWLRWALVATAPDHSWLKQL